jgi:hypothetical protein
MSRPVTLGRKVANFNANMRSFLTENVTKRNPNDKKQRGQQQALNSMKTAHALFSSILLIVGSIIYEQTMQPSIVHIPRLDGRSMVT